jgi:hypothetical protein
VRTTTEGAGDHINTLSLRYLGRPYGRSTADRLLIVVEPERVTGYGAGQPWDVEPA